MSENIYILIKMVMCGQEKALDRFQNVKLSWLPKSKKLILQFPKVGICRCRYFHLFISISRSHDCRVLFFF